MSEYILGLHFGHDATAALMKDGRVIEAMQEERLARVKKYVGFPHLAVAYIKKKYGLTNFSHIVVDGIEFGGHAFETLESNRAYRARDNRGSYFNRAIGAKFPFIGEIYRIIDISRFLKNIVNMETKTKHFLESMFPGAKIS